MARIGFYVEPNNRTVYDVSFEAGFYRLVNMDNLDDRLVFDKMPSSWRKVEMDTNGGWRLSQ